MQFIYRYAEFYKISDYGKVDFKNKEELLQKIKLVNYDSYLVLNDFIEGQLNLEFISNNLKLKEENPSMWKIALLHAKDEAHYSSLLFRSHSRKDKISLEKLKFKR